MSIISLAITILLTASFIYLLFTELGSQKKTFKRNRNTKGQFTVRANSNMIEKRTIKVNDYVRGSYLMSI